MNRKLYDKNKLIAVGRNNEEFPVRFKSKGQIYYKSKKVNFELLEDADGFSMISVNGTTYPAEVIGRKQNSYEVLVNGVSYHFSVETPFSLKRKKIVDMFKHHSKTENIKAPMPGKILDVIATQGQTVNIGEPLLILEAMKMQNTIYAHVNGTITKINIKTGDNVAKDDLMIVIEKI